MRVAPSWLLTFGANFFAIRAMSTLVRAAGMRGLAAMLRERKIAIEPMLDQVGIPRAALTDEEQRISLPAYAALLEQGAQRTGQPDLGLRIADLQDISVLGPLAIAMQNASTMREAMLVGSRFLHAHSTGMRLTLIDGAPGPGQATLRLIVLTPNWLPRRQLTDLCAADLHHFVTFLAQTDIPTIQMTLPGVPQAPLERYVRTFGPTVRFQGTQIELAIPASFLKRSLSGAVEALHRLGVEYLRLAFEGRENSVGGRVEDILGHALSSTRGRRDIVAKLLGLTPRTMQRRLEAEGVSFSDILEQVRRRLARYWLTETDVPLAHVADILGLADQSVLSRSCLRWFGHSPRSIRLNGVTASAADPGAAPSRRARTPAGSER